jgi:hypothetical protein
MIGMEWAGRRSGESIPIRLRATYNLLLSRKLMRNDTILAEPDCYGCCAENLGLERLNSGFRTWLALNCDEGFAPSRQARRYVISAAPHAPEYPMNCTSKQNSITLVNGPLVER